MEARLPYPDLTDKGESAPLLHLIDESDYSRFLCGKTRKPSGAERWVRQDEIQNVISCVVCADLGGST